jgi:two-component system phosphate regulon sensor histidine kinase PhoR
MNSPSKLFWKLFLGNAVLMAAVLGICVWAIVGEVDRFMSTNLTSGLHARAETLRFFVRDQFTAEHAQALDQYAKAIGAEWSDGVRITFIQTDGIVLGDSEADPPHMENHATRPEVQQALREGWGEDSRVSATVGRGLKYVAVRVGPPDAPLGVVRVAMTVRTIGERTDAMQKLIWAIALVGLLAAVALALGLARLWSGPVRRITAAARSLSHGDLSARAQVRGSDELAVLARSLNQMRDHLAEQLTTIDRQRRTLESLLAQLHEGVVVAGPDGRIMLINPAAVRLLAEPEAEAAPASAFEGRGVVDCVPQRELQALLMPQPDVDDGSRAEGASPDARLDRGGVREIRLAVDTPGGPVAILARVSDIVLPGFDRSGAHAEAQEWATGRLMVLTDITDLTRMIQVKADFAANASHELRTPVSAIRAAIETLLQVELASDLKTAGHFLSMIDRHSERMEAMVSDLLSLSRIESSPVTRFKPSTVRLREFLADVHSRHAEAMNAKNLHWAVAVPADLDTIEANPHLLRLTIDNLVDNATKFTDLGGHISVRLARASAPPPSGNGPAWVSIEVADDGCGIPEEEQSRVFERFYQVERARSGALRGTGLGLSIVRHAVGAMQGRVGLESRPGEGTRVTIHIPQPR